MKVIPFGEVVESRFFTARDHSLVEPLAGFWRMTRRAKDNYEEESFIRFLQGKELRPKRVSQEQEKQKLAEDVLEYKKSQQAINELLAM